MASDLPAGSWGLDIRAQQTIASSRNVLTPACSDLPRATPNCGLGPKRSLGGALRPLGLCATVSHGGGRIRTLRSVTLCVRAAAAVDPQSDGSW